MTEGEERILSTSAPAPQSMGSGQYAPSAQSLKFIGDAKTLLHAVIGDDAVPKNLKKRAGEIIDQLNDSTKSLQFRLNGAISTLDSMSGDPNLPTYVRTMLWQVASILERAGTA